MTDPKDKIIRYFVVYWTRWGTEDRYGVGLVYLDSDSVPRTFISNSCVERVKVLEKDYGPISRLDDLLRLLEYEVGLEAGKGEEAALAGLRSSFGKMAQELKVTERSRLILSSSSIENELPSIIQMTFPHHVSES